MKSHLASPMSAEGYIVSPALSDFSPDEIIAPLSMTALPGGEQLGSGSDRCCMAGRVFRGRWSGSGRKSSRLAAGASAVLARRIEAGRHPRG